jgi:hypothetical protein
MKVHRFLVVEELAACFEAADRGQRGEAGGAIADATIKVA